MPAEQKDPAASYIAAAIPPDSIENFVLLMTAKQWREVLAKGIALTRVIENIPRQGKEAQIVQLKLNWWLEETEMIARGKPRHPLSIDLSETLHHQDWLEPLRRLVENTLTDKTGPILGSMAECATYAHKAAERQVLIATMLPGGDETALEQARNGGVGICIAELLAHRRDSRLPENGLDGQTAAATAAQLTELAQGHFSAAEIPPGSWQRAQNALRLQARLYRRLLVRLRRNNYKPKQAEMHSVTLLWHAWREARNLMQ